MAINIDKEKRLFRLETKNTEYQLGIDDTNILFHAYYGRRTYGADMSYQNVYTDRGFSGNPYESRQNRGKSLDLIPQEFTGCGVGDFRVSSLSLVSENGSRSCDLRYTGYTIKNIKEPIQGLPYVRSGENESDTLIIYMEDTIIGMKVELIYSVFEKKDIITRRVVFTNAGKDDLVLEKASSMCIDFVNSSFDLIHFHGRHCMERQMERVEVTHDIYTIGSKRGMSSHHQNPFIILCDKDTTEKAGNCYGFMLVYSGNHKAEIEMEQSGSTRVVMGIHDENFSWQLSANESFYAPEVILSYSADGLIDLSHNYHRIIRENVCNPKYYNIKRPVLINNWEATYFDFNTEKIISLAKEAAETGIEMLVLDDGWFGIRNDDNSGLGDWFVNEDKLQGGLKVISDNVNVLGMKFGLWFEPEMINENSKLYHNHKDWVLCDPDRKPMMSRNQMVLDMGNKDVEDYLFECMSKVLDSANIEYIKWDFNRSIANVYSNKLPAKRQGEAAHRFMLGTYSLLERLLEKYPNLMIEGCAGGGGRFDAGMLYYCPQIWCSDDTDPIARLKIQHGTSYGYPVSTVGSHVSASPNHQTGRMTSLKTRGVVAMSGTFGYELDISKLSEKEKNIMKEQIKDFNKYYWLIQKGDYYRVSEDKRADYYTAWEFVDSDKKEILLNIVITDVQANPQIPVIKLQGLDEKSVYKADGCDREYTGAALMYGGYVLEDLLDVMCNAEEKSCYPTWQIHFTRI